MKKKNPRGKRLKGNARSANSKNEPNSRSAKITLLVFGLGPILLMGWFLTYNGFFTPIG